MRPYIEFGKPSKNSIEKNHPLLVRFLVEHFFFCFLPNSTVRKAV